MTPEPGSAYRRIGQNRFYTRILLGLFLVLVVPVFAFLSSYLGVWLLIYFLPDESGANWLVLSQLLAVVLMFCLVVSRVIHARNALPDMLGAIPLPRGQAGEAGQRLENLAIAAGVPTPRLFLLSDRRINALATGPDPDRSCILVTTGLIQKLGRRELDGVFAHELAHIANYDTRLNSTVAAILMTVRLPTPIYWLFLLAMVTLFSKLTLFGEMWEMLRQANPALMARQAYGPGGGMRAIGEALTWLVLSAVVVGLPLTMLWPALGRALQAMILRRREFLADAEAARTTRDPVGLASALTRIAGRDDAERPERIAEGPSARSALSRRSAAVEHLCLAPLDQGLLARLFRTHPPLRSRIAALAALAPPEPMPLVSSKLDAALGVEVDEAIEASARRAVQAKDSIFLPGFLAGLGVQTLLIVMSLARWHAGSIAPSAGITGTLYTVPFGFAGMAAAYVAMRRKGHFYWWPIVLMFAFGRYPVLILAIAAQGLTLPPPVGIGFVYLVSMLEPAIGATLGTISSGGLASLVRLLASRKPGR